MDVNNLALVETSITQLCRLRHRTNLHIYVALICVQLHHIEYIVTCSMRKRRHTVCCLLIHLNLRRCTRIHGTSTFYANQQHFPFVDSVTRWKWRQNLFIDAINSNHIRISRTQSHTWGHYYVGYIVCFH